MEKQIDYIEYLKPIIDDIKDGSDKNLTQNDVDYIINIIRAKIEFKEGLIDKEKYEEILYSDFNKELIFTNSDILSQDVIGVIFEYHGYYIEIIERSGSCIIVKDLRNDENFEIEVDELIEQDSNIENYLIK